MPEAPDPRQVPTRSIEAALQLVDGTKANATLFLSMTSPAHDGLETLDEFLNARRRFLPVRTEHGNGLIAREAIITLRVPSGAEGGRPLAGGAPPAIDMIRIVLEGGAVVVGMLLHGAATGDRTRLSDFFNTDADFFAIEDDSGIVHVSKRHVVSITF